MIKKLWMLGKNGNITDVIGDQIYLKNLADELPPVIEIDFATTFADFGEYLKPANLWLQSKGKYEGMAIWLHNIYNTWGRFGSIRDIMQVTIADNEMSVDFIGTLSPHKACLAADILPFFINEDEGQAYFVGIVRTNFPNIGQPALTGGFRDVRGYHFETGTEAAIREGIEEINLQIRALTSRGFASVYDPFNEDYETVYSVEVNLADQIHEANMYELGTFPTSDSEKLIRTGRKRVYETSAYVLPIVMDCELSEERIQEWLKAQNEIKELFVWDLAKNDPIFPNSHHNTIYEAAIELLYNKNYLNSF
jgi:hypothetical protein